MDETATSQPPPATNGGSPWGSFYTAPNGTKAGSPAKVKSKPPRRSRRSRGASEPPEEKPKRRPRGALTGGGRRNEDQRGPRKSFRLRGPKREGRGSAGEAPVAESVTAPSVIPPSSKPRRYAEPHVLVAVAGGTLIALAAILIALLYMIGNAA